MTMTATPIFPQTPITAIATLTAPVAITSRANITGVAGLVALSQATTNGLRMDSIKVKSKGTSLAGILFVWLSDGTTSYLFDEIDLTAITGSATVDSASATAYYNGVSLPPTYRLYVSISVVQDVNVFLQGGAY